MSRVCTIIKFTSIQLVPSLSSQPFPSPQPLPRRDREHRCNNRYKRGYLDFGFRLLRSSEPAPTDVGPPTPRLCVPSLEAMSRDVAQRASRKAKPYLCGAVQLPTSRSCGENSSEHSLRKVPQQCQHATDGHTCMDRSIQSIACQALVK